MKEFTVKELDLLILGLDAIGKAEAATNSLGRIFTDALARGAHLKGEERDELRQALSDANKKEREGNEERDLEIQILRGALFQIKRDLLRAQPFAGMESVNLGEK